MTMIRAVLYLTFASVAVSFWLAVLVLADDALGERACLFGSMPCAETSSLYQLTISLMFFAAIPLTALAFSVYRRFVRRRLSRYR